jgi:hypothetical protein
MTENKYQAMIIKQLEDMFPGCLVVKLDTSYRQGLPDLLILWQRFWAVLEVKPKKEALSQPNQEYYIEQLNEMSFAAYIYPENEVEVLSALQQAFKSPGRTRVSQS